MLDLLDDAPAHKVDDLLAPAAHLGAERRRRQRRDEEDGTHRMPGMDGYCMDGKRAVELAC